MTGWAQFWQYVIYTALGLYFGLAFAITVGGFFDVKKMFRRLNEAHAAAHGGSTRPPRENHDEPGT